MHDSGYIGIGSVAKIRAITIAADRFSVSIHLHTAAGRGSAGRNIAQSSENGSCGTSRVRRPWNWSFLSWQAEMQRCETVPPRVVGRAMSALRQLEA